MENLPESMFYLGVIVVFLLVVITIINNWKHGVSNVKFFNDISNKIILFVTAALSLRKFEIPITQIDNIEEDAPDEIKVEEKIFEESPVIKKDPQKDNSDLKKLLKEAKNPIKSKAVDDQKELKRKIVKKLSDGKLDPPKVE